MRILQCKEISAKQYQEETQCRVQHCSRGREVSQAGQDNGDLHTESVSSSTGGFTGAVHSLESNSVQSQCRLSAESDRGAVARYSQVEPGTAT